MSHHPITGKTALVGLMGWPVEHSLSPAMHNAAFAQLGLDWTYVPLPVQPQQVEQALKGLAALNFKGVNVTVPHKQAVMRYLDTLSDAAQFTGAVNTIVIEEGQFHGYNTDARGFLQAMEESGYQAEGMRVAVLGAGGASRAAVFALARAKAHAVTVINRTAERAAFLVEDLKDSFPDCHLTFAAFNEETLATLNGDIDLIVNTTSVGMSPNITACPWPEDVPMPPQAVYYDLVYNPLETTFLRRARDVGADTIDGLGMLVHQGARSFSIWTGEQPSTDVMRQASLQGLEG